MTGDGEARAHRRFWLLVLLTGVLTGLFGDLLMWLLFTVQHLAFGFNGRRVSGRGGPGRRAGTAACRC